MVDLEVQQEIHKLTICYSISEQRLSETGPDSSIVRRSYGWNCNTFDHCKGNT